MFFLLSSSCTLACYTWRRGLLNEGVRHSHGLLNVLSAEFGPFHSSILHGSTVRSCLSTVLAASFYLGFRAHAFLDSQLTKFPILALLRFYNPRCKSVQKNLSNFRPPFRLLYYLCHLSYSSSRWIVLNAFKTPTSSLVSTFSRYIACQSR